MLTENRKTTLKLPALSAVRNARMHTRSVGILVMRRPPSRMLSMLRVTHHRVPQVGGNTVIFDREIHVAEGAPMKSMSIEKLRTV